MHRYNIIKKQPRNLVGKTCIIEYQVDEGCEIYTVKMLCLYAKNKIGRYVFIDREEGYLIETKEEKQAFVDELKDYQTSYHTYRKNHPIIESKELVLRNNIKKLKNQIEKYEAELGKLEEDILANKAQAYLNELNHKDVMNKLLDFIKVYKAQPFYLTRISTFYSVEDHYYIVDSKINKPVGKLIVSRLDGCMDVEDLTLYDAKEIIIKEQNKKGDRR